MAVDPIIELHKEWLGYLQPVGLVVAPSALANAQAVPNPKIMAEQARFLGHLREVTPPGSADDVTAVTDWPAFCLDVLGWQPGDLVGHGEAGPVPDDLEVVLPDHGETLRPTYAVPDPDAAPGNSRRWQMLIEAWPVGTPLDEAPGEAGTRWDASPQARFERLLRETRVPIGLLLNGTHLRLVYAPRGESSGHLTFPVAAMAEVPGRPIFSALLMLLAEDRLFSIPEPKHRLPAILAESRRYQNDVSTKLAGQVLSALFELVRGFQAADDQARGELLRDVLAGDPDEVYGGLLTTLLRLVFLLYAEDRGLLPDDPVYLDHYSVGGLFERLRGDAAVYPDTMDGRFGSWPQLLSLFRLIHDGGGHGANLRVPARKGYLFDPDRYPFLEGRRRDEAGSRTGSDGTPTVPVPDPDGIGGQAPSEYRRSLSPYPSPVRLGNGPRIVPPLVADGVVHRVLEKLLILDGERLSYRTLDVEQIGSVYETMMGFRVEIARGRSIAVKAKKAQGAPVAVDLDALLAVDPKERPKALKALTDQEVSGDGLKSARSVDDLVAALGRKVAVEATPRVVPPGAMLLQPGDERRRSGSHYTPRSLTRPIVETTLAPVLAALGDRPTPAQILDLKVCDPAMGSGAFLVEACRQLGDRLVIAWHAHGPIPPIPADEDESLHARRIVAQRCLYGVDRNPMAVDLAKLSLWLATLARDHPFTFLDHALRHGDSLVGLSRAQVVGFGWKPEARKLAFMPGEQIAARLDRVTAFRREIREAAEAAPESLLRQKLALADEAVNPLRFYGDLVVSAFFAGSNDKARKSALEDRAEALSAYLANPHHPNLRRPLDVAHRALRAGDKPVIPFHWEIEFPEVFDRANPGFDAIVGNPPFLGGTMIGGQLGLDYHDYLVELYLPATGLADLISFFLRRSFDLLRVGGTFGLIATNTVAQGDTRSTGLEPIVKGGGSIFEATRRYKWPGVAAVVVSAVHVVKANSPIPPVLDGVTVGRISAFLLKGDADEMPVNLASNKGLCFLGTKIWGSGFVFEDNPSDGSSSISEMERLVSQDPRNRDVIFPYMGGEEFNTSPTQSPRRFVIDFGQMVEPEARRWPSLFSIVEERVRPVRAGNKQRNYRDNWWLHANRVEEATPFSRLHGRLIALTSVSKHLSSAFVRPGTIIANSMVLILLHEDADFAVIQSRVHELWARLIGSSMKDDLRYTTPCFDSFPRPDKIDHSALNDTGSQYYDFRARLMKDHDEGLTATYNRFHDPDERSADILRLRELHAAMDRAVLDAYGWTDVRPTCEFLLDYEDDDEADEADAPGRRRKKKPYRLRWPDPARDDVLARLLQLNRDRAEAEARPSALGSMDAAPAGGKPKRSKKAGRTKSGGDLPGLS